MKYVKIDVKTKDKNFLPFLGSMLRGAFGSALKDVVCINPTKECGGCFAAGGCLYFDFFEAKNRFHNFRLDFELNPKNLDFSLVLFNEAIEKHPYILSALHRMLTQKGLGRERRKSEIDKIIINGQSVFEDGEFKSVAGIEGTDFSIERFSPAVKIELITPLRIKREGRFVRPENLELKDILLSLVKKQAFFDGVEAKLESFGTIVSKNLSFADFTRYSNRQKRKMKIGGIVGEIVAKDLDPTAYRLLKYGEITGVGKLNTFGLGKIEVEDLICEK